MEKQNSIGLIPEERQKAILDKLKEMIEREIENLDEGDSGIHIKKKNRGKFTATKKRTGKSTEELTHSKNPLTRKRAIFAQNAMKWNHKKKQD